MQSWCTFSALLRLLHQYHTASKWSECVRRAGRFACVMRYNLCHFSFVRQKFRHEETKSSKWLDFLFAYGLLLFWRYDRSNVCMCVCDASEKTDFPQSVTFCVQFLTSCNVIIAHSPKIQKFVAAENRLEFTLWNIIKCILCVASSLSLGDFAARQMLSFEMKYMNIVIITSYQFPFFESLLVLCLRRRAVELRLNINRGGIVSKTSFYLLVQFAVWWSRAYIQSQASRNLNPFE